METTNTISFYWIAKFDDGFVLPQFKSDGTETVIRDILPPYLIAKQNLKLSIIGKNVFAGIEQNHGRCVEFGWHPFDHDLANAVRALNNYNIAELETEPLITDVPEDSYPKFHRESLVGYGMSNEPFKEDHKLGIGLIKRTDEENHVHATRYDENDNVIETKNDKSFGNKDLEIRKKPKE